MDSRVSVTNRPFSKPAQDKADALILGGKDVLIEVEDGRGVEVFGPVVVQMVLEMLKGVPKARKNLSRIPRAAILEPTKVSATKTFKKIQHYAKQANDPHFRLMLAVDGVDTAMLKTRWKNGADIVVGTPSNMQQIQKAGFLNLAKCRIFVVDEAYFGCKGIHAEVIDRLHHKTPKRRYGRPRQTILCSSILGTTEIQDFAKKHMHSPAWVNLRGNEALPATAFHTVVKINPRQDSSWKKFDGQIITDGVHSKDDFNPEKVHRDTFSAAVKILRVAYIVCAIDVHNMDKAVIICRTRMDCDNLDKYLKHLNKEKYSCACYSALKGDKPSKGLNLASFTDGDIKFLICTEEEFRQVRITELPFLINASFPSDKYDYLKRAEKIGSNECLGLVINLVAAVQEKVWELRKLPSANGYSWNTEPAENTDVTVWHNELENLLHVENQFNTKIFEIEPNMKVPSVEVNGQRYSGDKGQQSGTGGKRFPSWRSRGGAHKRFRRNDDVSISISPDEVPTTDETAADTDFRAAISHPGYPTSELSNDQLVTLQRSIMKAVELVPDDGPQVRFQECSQKSGWLLIVCTDQESYSWLQNTVKDLQPWEGAQLQVVQEKELIPETFVFEAFIPDEVGIRATSDQVLTRLRKMNRALNTDKWTILHQEESEGGQKWTFKVDKASMTALEGMDHSPYFGFGQVQFVRKSEVELPKPQDSEAMKEDAVEALESGTSATEPKESANSASKPPEGETSLLGEDSVPKEENTCVAESIADKTSAVDTSNGGISATENSDAASKI